MFQTARLVCLWKNSRACKKESESIDCPISSCTDRDFMQHIKYLYHLLFCFMHLNNKGPGSLLNYRWMTTNRWSPRISKATPVVVFNFLTCTPGVAHILRSLVVPSLFRSISKAAFMWWLSSCLPHFSLSRMRMLHIKTGDVVCTWENDQVFCLEA